MYMISLLLQTSLKNYNLILKIMYKKTDFQPLLQSISTIFKIIQINQDV